jgi:sulfite exporter TauE/SafE
MQFTEGFLLGLSTGAVCLSYCGPVLIPFMMGEGRSVAGNSVTVGLFLGGRLLAYTLVGLAAGLVGTTLLQPSSLKSVFFGILYIILAISMIAYGFYRFREICLGQKVSIKSHTGRWPHLVPVAGGFATGLNICPPFLLALAGAVDSGHVSSSLIFFLMFFLGTSVFFIPMPFIGFFRKQHVLRVVGKFASLLAGFIFLYKGIIILISSQP